MGKQFRLDRQRDQGQRFMLWCEASGVVPQLQRVAEPYGIDVYCSGGFDKVTGKREIGIAFATLQQPVTVLHIGDHDRSGVHIFEALAGDIIAFADAEAAARDLELSDIEFVRQAITPDLAAQYDVPDNGAPNPNDKRRFDRYAVRCASGGDPEYRGCDPRVTRQAEGLDPATLAALIGDAITKRTDSAVYDAVLDHEDAVQTAIATKLANLEAPPPPARRLQRPQC